MQATEIERNGAGDTAFSYDRFRQLAIETRAENIIKRFTIALSGLAKFSKRDPNPYLMAFIHRSSKCVFVSDGLWSGSNSSDFVKSGLTTL